MTKFCSLFFTIFLFALSTYSIESSQSLVLSNEEKSMIEFSRLKKIISAKECDESHIPYIKELLLRNDQFPGKDGLLEDLCCLGNVDIINNFLSVRGFDYREAGTRENSCLPAVYFACIHQKYDLVKFLIERKESFCCGNSSGDLLTYLMKDFVRKKRNKNTDAYKIVELLLKNKNELNKKIRTGLINKKFITFECLAECIRYQNIDFTKLLLDHGAALKMNSNCFYALCECEHRLKTREQYHNNGLEEDHIDKIYNQGFSCKHIEIANLLFEKNPNLVTLRDEKGDTPLHIASKMQNAVIIDFLLSKGAKTNVINNKQDTPLLCVISHVDANQYAVQSLLEHDANPNAINAEGYTALSFLNHCDISQEIKKPIIELLLNHGATSAYVVISKNSTKLSGRYGIYIIALASGLLITSLLLTTLLSRRSFT